MIGEIFSLLARSPVPLMIIGGHALAAHGIQRMTFDVDCLTVTDNFDALAALLTSEGFSNVVHLANFSAFHHPDPAKSKIDVMRVDSSTFSKLYSGSRLWDFDGPQLSVPALEHLIALKLHAIKNNRERSSKDGWDIAALLGANPGAISRDKMKEICDRFGPPGEWETYQHHASLSDS